MNASSKRPDITVTLRCNNRCVFCPRTVLRHIAVRSRRGLNERLDQVRSRSDRVVLTGGEVTILRDFLRIVARCRQRGFREIAVISNGRRLADPAFAVQAVEAGVTEICITLYDLRARVHDSLTGVQGSLAETLKGLDNMLGLSSQGGRPVVRINTVLTARNADGMIGLVRDMAGRGIPSILIADAVLSDSFNRPLDYGRVARIAGRIAAEGAGGASSVVFRGFPPCIFRSTAGITEDNPDRPGSVRYECQNIDTAFLPGDDVDRYFGEFYSNFERVDACRRCGARRLCPGIQKLYLEAMGRDGFAPLRAAGRSAPSRRRGISVDVPSELIEERPDPGRIAVTPTTACQLRCSYCQVMLGRRRSPAEVMDRAVDLLATTSSKRPELQFFGGEPLLRWPDVRRTIERADRVHAGLHILHTITTNGLLLDRAVLDFLRERRSRIIFSMDGDLETQTLCRFRGRKDAGRLQAKMERNLDLLLASGVSFFANMVFTPETLPMLEENADYLVRRGVKVIQVCYANGIVWSGEEVERAASAVASIAGRSLGSRAGGGFRLQNLGSRVEPAMLSNDLLVDVDGTLYGDAALFCEKALPGLRAPYRLGTVRDLRNFDGLRSTKGGNLEILRQTFPEGSATRSMIESQLRMGMRMAAALQDAEGEGMGARSGSRAGRPIQARSSGTQDGGEVNPLLTRVFSKGLRRQVAFMKKHPNLMKLPVLLIENDCFHDCIFCKRKPLKPTPMRRVEAFLEEDAVPAGRRLGLIGNEPLAHPEILSIVAAARRAGFRSFDVLTSGQPLADEAFFEKLFKAGVRSFSLPLYARRADVHDGITGTAGSYDRTLRGIKLARAAGARIHVHANLVKQNMSHLPGLEAMVTRSLGLPFCIIPTRPKMSNLPYADLAPSYSEIISRLRGRVTTLVGFPACVCAAVQEEPLIDASLISDLLKLYLLDQPYVKPRSVCAGCLWQGRCSGTYLHMLRLYGPHSLPGQAAFSRAAPVDRGL